MRYKFGGASVVSIDMTKLLNVLSPFEVFAFSVADMFVSGGPSIGAVTAELAFFAAGSALNYPALGRGDFPPSSASASGERQ